MEFIRHLLEQQPLMALFLTIAIGYLAGEISLKGLSLGVGAVLFVALAVGSFAPRSAPPAMVGTLGLALFLYAVGIQYGRQFFQGLTSPAGLRGNLIGVVGVLVAGATSLVLVRVATLKIGYALGLFAGAGTSTPTLQAAIVALGNDDPAIGYSVAYPVGVAGPILCLYLAFAWLKPKIEAPSGSGMAMLEVCLREPRYFGKTIRELTAALPSDVRIVAVRRHHRNTPASPDFVVAKDDVFLVTAPSGMALQQVEAMIGEAAPGRLAKDRSHLDYLRVFASKTAVVGRSIADLELPGGQAAAIMHVRRGDVDLQPDPNLVVEFGDRVGMLAHRDDFPAIRAFFGDSIKGTAEFSYISIGLGIALGFLVGAIAIPLPGKGAISLGLSGVLIVALVLGHLRRTGGLNWTIPLSASLVLRNLGLTLFLAQVGMASGPKFAATVSSSGLMLLGLGTLVTMALVLPVLLLGLFAFRMPFDQVAGIIAGACGNPAVLAFATKLAPTDKPDLGYAMIFPGMTILKILFVDVAPSFF